MPAVPDLDRDQNRRWPGVAVRMPIGEKVLPEDKQRRGTRKLAQRYGFLWYVVPPYKNIQEETTNRLP